MRAVSQAWGSLNASKSRERRFYFRVITTPGDETGDVYIRSHDDIDISTTGSILLARPKSHPKIRTQNLNPDEGRSTIGTMTFDAIDVDSTLTGRLRLDLIVNDVGWRNKRVEYYSGFKQITAADYELEDTQLIDRVTYSRAVYQFRCRDVQREARKRIFEPVVMRLAQPLDDESTTIEVSTTSGLEAVEHGTSYSDAPSATVAYVKIDDEIIRVPTAGIGATQLTGCTRGVLRTRAAAHTTDEGASSARGKEVTEVIYLELPVPKLVYALLTGVLIGQVETLPDHWHLGIDASDFVRLSEFQNIGDDLYVQADDTLGMIEQHILTDAEDGKTFIEKEILRKYGLFMPIHANGEIGLKRGQSVLSGSAVVGVIDDSMIVDEVTIAYAMDKIINEIRIGWNEINGEPSRFLNIIDQESVTKWEAAPPLDVVARGLVGSRQTDSRVRDIFEGLRDRYSGPPIVADVTVHSSQSLFEVGDVVRLRTSTVRDFTSALATTLDRAFEIQGVSKNLSNGTVTYSLFGSSQAAGPLPPIETTAALDDAFYVSGTNIAGMSGVVDEGSELVLPNGITFAGAATVAGAVYYATKDVRLPSGRTANYTQNAQLRIRGVLQIDGEFSGVGAGLAGVADTVVTSGIPTFGAVQGPITFATQAGTPGYFGVTQAGGGLIERVLQRGGSSSKYRVRIQSVPATITQGRVEAIPSLNLTYNGSSIAGIPSDLRGTSGGPGGLRYWNDSDGPRTDINRGGDGGAGGAGLLIICRGMVFGASGRIDSSGADGSPGVRNAANEQPAWSSGGAGGAPGATIILLDGVSSPSPVLTSGTIIADYGDTPGPGDPHNVMPDSFIEHQETRFGPPTVTGAFVEDDRASFFTSGTSGRQAGIAAARFFFLLPPVTPEEDTNDLDLAAAQNISLAISEAFEARQDPSVTTLLATITEVSTTAAYSHANIYVRGNSAGAQYPDWLFVGSAEPTLEFELPADGETYSIRAVPVLINGVEAPSGTEQTTAISPPGVIVEVSLSGPPSWVQEAGGGNWQPDTTTNDVTFTFKRKGVQIAQHVVRVTRSTSDLSAATQGTPSGEATTLTSPVSGDGTSVITVFVTHDDSGAQGQQTLTAVESGSDGAQGPAGEDGAPGIAPFSGFEGHVGAFTNAVLRKNETGAGGADVGEIGIDDSIWFFRDGTSYDTGGVLTLTTPYEGAITAEQFYVILGVDTAQTRFGTGFGTHRFFVAEYAAATDTWTARGNGNESVSYTPLATDHIVAIGSKTLASGGIGHLAQIGGSMNLDATSAPVFIQAAAITNALIGSLAADKITTGNLTVALNLTTGNLQVSSTGKMFSGKDTFGSASDGWFIGRDGGEPAMILGNADGSFRYKPSTGPLYSGVTLNLSPLTITHTVSDNSNGITFGIDSVQNAHKFISYERENFGTINAYQWILGGDPNDYEAMFSVDTSSNMTRDTGYLSLDTWHDIGAMTGGETNHRWKYTTGISQTGALTGTLTIRHKTNTAVSVSTEVDLTLTDT